MAVVQPWNRGRDDTSFENPATVELPPPPSSPDTTRDYLSGSNGDKLRRLIDVSTSLETSDAETCQEAASTLDAIGRPDELFGIADGIPDGPTREIALSHLDELARYLGVCLQEGRRPVAEALTFKRVVLERRLEAVG